MASKNKEDRKNTIIGGIIVAIIICIVFALNGNKNNNSQEVSELQKKADTVYEWYKTGWKAEEEKYLQEFKSENARPEDITEQEKNISQIEVVTGFYADDHDNFKIKADYQKAQELNVTPDNIANQVNTALYQYPEASTLTFANFNYAKQVYGWKITEEDIDWGEYQSQIDEAKKAEEEKKDRIQDLAWQNCEAYGKSHYYNFKWHTITGLVADEAYQDGWLMKVNVDVSNAYGAKISGVMECITDSNGAIKSFNIY